MEHVGCWVDSSDGCCGSPQRDTARLTVTAVCQYGCNKPDRIALHTGMIGETCYCSKAKGARSISVRDVVSKAHPLR